MTKYLEHKRTTRILLVDGRSLVAISEHGAVAVRIGNSDFHLRGRVAGRRGSDREDWISAFPHIFRLRSKGELPRCTIDRQLTEKMR